MDARIKEAVDLFTEVMVYGTERVIKSVDDPLWKEYSPEQIQLLKLIGREQRITSGRLAVMQGVHKSAVSSRISSATGRVDNQSSGKPRSATSSASRPR